MSTIGLALLVAIILAGRPGPPARTSTPLPTGTDAQRVAAAIERQFASGAQSGAEYQRIRAIIVLKQGRTLFERYYDSSPQTYHDVQAVTTSVMSTLVGIAVGEGRLRLDDPLSKLLPAYAAVMTPAVAGATLRQVLTMTAGFSDEVSRNEPRFRSAPDWTREILRTPVTRPGQHFLYSNGSAHLLSAILEQATGEPLLAYAREKLFDPLGIRTFAWPVDPQGRPTGWAFLKLRPRDLANLGQLFLDDGRWQGRQLIPAAWAPAATVTQVSPRVRLAEEYGYLWRIRAAGDDPAYAAMGSGGQLLEVVPALDLVVAVATEFSFTDLTDRGVDPSLLNVMVESFIVPALRGAV